MIVCGQHVSNRTPNGLFLTSHSYKQCYHKHLCIYIIQETFFLKYAINLRIYLYLKPFRQSKVPFMGHPYLFLIHSHLYCLGVGIFHVSVCALTHTEGGRWVGAERESVVFCLCVLVCAAGFSFTSVRPA